MSRSGYNDGDCDSVEDMLRMYAWNANVRRHIGGRKGQAFMWELYQALEALPSRELITGALMDRDGAYCSLGAVARFRGIQIPTEWVQTADNDPEDYDYEFAEAMGPLLGIKDMMAREVMYENDDASDWHDVPGPPRARWQSGPHREEMPEERWYRVREWVVSKLRGIP